MKPTPIKTLLFILVLVLLGVWADSEDLDRNPQETTHEQNFHP
jgi:hypothetical protein